MPATPSWITATDLWSMAAPSRRRLRQRRSLAVPGEQSITIGGDKGFAYADFVPPGGGQDDPAYRPQYDELGVRSP